MAEARGLAGKEGVTKCAECAQISRHVEGFNGK